MAKWRPKSPPLFSPREVVAQNLGPNTVRYVSRRIETPVRQVPNFDAPMHSTFSNGKRKKKWANYWDEEYDGIPKAKPIEREKPKFAWEASRWSNYNFGSYYVDQDDDTTLFVKAPENYMTPTASQIKLRTSVHLTEEIKRIKELARVCYLKMIDDKNYIDEKFQDKYECGMNESAWDKKKSMYDNVYETFIPGYTPLEQAIAINYKVRDTVAKNLQNKVKARTEKSERFSFKRSDYADPDLNSQLEMNPLSKERKIEILNKISLIGDMGTQFKVEKYVGEIEVANSHIRRKKVMREYSQLSKVDLYQRLLPTFKYKFYSKNLVVNAPVRVSEKKQKIIIVCDYSGSMDEDEKQIWVNAILIDRFRYVMRGEAEVYFSHFVANPQGLRFSHIKDAKDVAAFWKKFSNRPSGSATDIARIVEYIAQEVVNSSCGRFHNLDINLSNERPEILVLNDGRLGLGV